ncbi:hypothetical protein Poli38472_003052 [Pythium oligandrum]|uniref:DUF7492 domain-containing protein n=1 Tax=Pythium oligandrum TaxID=41045 RepID=A0A8K1C5X8_PYTOL|nr:hypothetical protein Poli38472_003052 [Pythium oligandrum]|eukprot:TMW57127.1 hypothetical protein Poli38472_003052 [Pythium oligandrum]
MRLTKYTAAALIAVAQFVDAHTWIDCLDTDMNVVLQKWKEQGACKGYIKNYTGRASNEVDIKSTVKTDMMEVSKGGKVCDAGPGNYVDWRHRLQVQPGQPFYFGYLENGHVSKDESGRGTYYGTFWTGQPNTVLEKTSDMTPDKLVDGFFHDYDDTRCGESTNMNGQPSGRAGDGVPCIGKLAIPAGTAPGIYTLVWYWRYFKNVGGVPQKITNEKGTFGGSAYASCYEVEVLGPGGASVAAPAPAPAAGLPAQNGTAPAPGIVQTSPVAVTPSAAPTMATIAPAATLAPQVASPTAAPALDTALAPSAVGTVPAATTTVGTTPAAATTTAVGTGPVAEPVPAAVGDALDPASGQATGTSPTGPGAASAAVLSPAQGAGVIPQSAVTGVATGAASPVAALGVTPGTIVN